MEMGIDLGYSSTKIVILDKGKVVYKLLVEGMSRPKLERQITALLKTYHGVRKIGITGGKSAFMKLKLNIPVTKVQEVEAIGKAGLYLAKKKKAIVVSCGTGTCIVAAQAAGCQHIGGTGVGGGTILGLGNRLLGISDVKQLELLSKKGFLSKVDLQVGDIVSAPIGLLPKNITASNFGRLTEARREDLAKAILNLVAEVIATTALFAAKTANQTTIFLTGRVSIMPYVYSRMRMIAKLFRITMHRVPYPAYGTAIGAALLAR